MAEHKHGNMNTSTQEKTFAGFVTIVGRAVIIILVALVLLALVNG